MVELRLYGLALLLFRYDLDGIFEATPGCRRAVQTAVTALQSNGHRVLPFRPPHLLKAMRVNTLYRAGDLGARHQAQLAIGPVCTKAFGLKHLCRIIPRLLRSSLATGKYSIFMLIFCVNFSELWNREVACYSIKCLHKYFSEYGAHLIPSLCKGAHFYKLTFK